MVPTFTRKSINGLDARLNPDSLAMATPQTFTMASPPDQFNRLRSQPSTSEGCALHTGPYPSGLSRHWTYRASHSGFSRTPSHHC